MVIRTGTTDFPKSERLDGLYFALPLIGIAVYWFLGLYRFMLRSISGRAITVCAFGAFVASLFIPAWNYFDPEILIPRSVPIIYGLLVIVFVGALRMSLMGVWLMIVSQSDAAKRTLVYGAGAMGQQIGSLLVDSSEHKLVGFLDDDRNLHGASLLGRRIYSPDKLPEVKEQLGVHEILLAIKQFSPRRQRRFFNRTSELGIPIKVVPDISRLVSDSTENVVFEPLQIEDLLDRDSVEPNWEFISSNLDGKRILVTGAAGSIGSEICRQVLKNKPELVIALDSSELGLYNFEKELEGLAASAEVDVRMTLGSVLDKDLVTRILTENKIDFVYHAAAYKHVPLVEKNPLAAAENNILGTQVLTDAAIEAGVSRFILISTDKAVRPTNIMGATKRLAELLVQDAQRRTNGKKTVLTMVRFGNVLGSSGSVIPLFTKQIAEGGPITLTNKEVTRYLMTIQEAAQLVIQAGFMARGGEVFLLDMGKPVKLLDVVTLMIQLSGNTVFNEETGTGTIEIKEIGLRPGEKLYEELLIGDNASGTDHRKIMCAVEESIDPKTLARIVDDVKTCIKKGDCEKLRSILERHASLTAPNTSSRKIQDVRVLSIENTSALS